MSTVKSAQDGSAFHIRKITIIPLTAPWVWPHTPPDHWVNGVRNCVWMRIDTDEGLSGWGEAYFGCYATDVTIAGLNRLTRTFVGKGFTDPTALLAKMRFDNLYWAMRGIGAQCISAVESALWDIVAQARGVPLWQLLGDGKPHPVLAYASAGLSAVPPAEIRQETKDFVSQGFNAYKMRAGDPDPDPAKRLAFDLDRIAAAREGLGPDRMLIVDLAVPQRPELWDFARVEGYIRGFQRYNVRFLEEPGLTYDVEMYRRLQELGLVPIAGGESFCIPDEFEPFFAAKAMGVAQPDAAVVGGPVSCVQVMRRAAECGVKVAIHAWSAGVGLAQNLHAACSLPGTLVMECPMAFHRLTSDPVRDIWKLKDGLLHPPTRPGLGVTITPELLESCVYQPDSERNF